MTEFEATQSTGTLTAMTDETHPFELRTLPNPPFSKPRKGRWLVVVGVFTCLIAALLCGLPYYRKAILIQEIKREHGMTACEGIARPVWAMPILKRLGEPYSSQVVELIFDPLVYVRLDGQSVESTTAGSARILLELSRHHKLRRLDVLNMRLTPEHVQALRGLPNLEELCLSGCSLASSDWELLTDFTALEKLDLAECKFGDEDMGVLSRMTKLQTLNLSGTQVTDVTVPELKNLKSLRQLDFSQTAVSEVACRKLVKAIPGLDVSDD